MPGRRLTLGLDQGAVARKLNRPGLPDSKFGTVLKSMLPAKYAFRLAWQLLGFSR